MQCNVIRGGKPSGQNKTTASRGSTPFISGRGVVSKQKKKQADVQTSQACTPSRPYSLACFARGKNMPETMNQDMGGTSIQVTIGGTRNSLVVVMGTVILSFLGVT